MSTSYKLQADCVVALFDEIRNDRVKKLNLLREKGINPYPVSSSCDFSLAQVNRDFNILFKKKKDLFLVGRVLRLRRQGGMIFFHISDGTGEFQGMMRKDEAPKKFSLFVDTVDIGDFLELKGNLLKTKRGEKSIFIKKWRMLAKSLRPLPDKWHGLQDVEERFRKRYLDFLMSEEARTRLNLRSELISLIRSFLDENGYLEVETPTLQPLYGGGNAEPFTTHHKSLDIDLYLRISNELYLKRLLIGGIPRVYEVYKGFRNEGIDAVHYPEFTMVEFYESFSDSKKQMIFVEKMIKALVKKLHKKPTLSFRNHAIDFSKKFKIVSLGEIFKQYARIHSYQTLNQTDWERKAEELGLAKEGGSMQIADAVFKKTCRPHLIKPTFVVDYPIEYVPLAKRKEGEKDTADMFQLVIGGIECVKAYSELNDPLEQKERFTAQEKLRQEGNKETQPMDSDFLEALEYGMPPAGGVGIGIDRLVMLLTDTANIKETILFPTMKPKN